MCGFSHFRAIAGFAPIRQNRDVWNNRPYARPTSTNSSPLPTRSGNLGACLACAARSTIRRWSSASPPGNGARLRLTFSARGGVEGHSRRDPEYAAIHSHVLQDVLARLDKTYQAFFRRVKAGRRRASHAIRTRPLAFVHLQRVWQRRDAGQRLSGPVEDWAYRRTLVSPAQGTPKTVTIAEKRMAGRSASPAPTCQYNPYPQLDRKPALTWGLTPLLPSRMAHASSLPAGIAKPNGH